MPLRSGVCRLKNRNSLAGSLLLLLAAGCCRADTFTVTNLETSGAGSLPQAILDANAHPGADRIAFNLEAGTSFLIAPDEPLPAITEAVTIDGTTQPGYVDRPLVTIDASFVNSADASGLEIRAANCTVKGLAFTGFAGAGLLVQNASACKIEQCFSGITADGSVGFGNAYGIALIDSSQCVINHCVLSGNNAGLLIMGNSTANVLNNSFVGTDLVGGLAVENFYGVVLSGAGTQSNTIENSILAGNFVSGVTIDAGANHNQIQFNQIGINAFFDELGNGFNGVEILSGAQNSIENNFIVGNPAAGISLSGAFTRSNALTGNFIYGSLAGVNVEAGANNNDIGEIAGPPNTLTGNLLAGIRIVGANTTQNRVAANVITGNTGDGAVIASSFNQLLSNYIYGNVSQGVRVRAAQGGGYPSGVFLKDNLIFENGDLGILLEGSGGIGANGLQPAPELLSADTNSAATFVVARLRAAPLQTYAVQIFAIAEPDPSGYGEGEILLGSGTITTNSDGVGNVSLRVSPVDVGYFVSATAAAPDGSSSEFSAVQIVGQARPVPVIDSVSPASALAGSAAASVIVRGSNFVADSKIRWNDADRATIYVSDTELRFVIPFSDLLTPGNNRITVSSPAPGGGISNEANFAVLYPVPAAASLSPASVVKGSDTTTLTITGSGFYPASKARWNGSDRATTFVSSTKITFDAPKADLAAAAVAQVTVF